MKKARPPGEELIRFLTVYYLSVSELALKLRDLVLAEVAGKIKNRFVAVN